MSEPHCVARDGCVVDTEPLAHLVRSWVSDYERSALNIEGVKTGLRAMQRDERGYFSGRAEGCASFNGVAALADRTRSLAESSTVKREAPAQIEDVDGVLVAAAAPPPTQGVHPDRIRRVMRVASRTTELRIADLLVTAIGQPQALVNGQLRVRPRSRHASCCGGSILH